MLHNCVCSLVVQLKVHIVVFIQEAGEISSAECPCTTHENRPISDAHEIECALRVVTVAFAL